MAGSAAFQGGELLNSLAAQQVRRTDITDVVFTHLHFDHIGWASREGAVVVFGRLLSANGRRSWVL